MEHETIEMQSISHIEEKSVYKPPMVQQSHQLSTADNLLQIAVQRGASMEELQRLMELKERFEANEAKKAFVAAVSAFNCENILVSKDKENKQYKSNYTSLGNLVNTVRPFLGKHGLSASWDQVQNPALTITCTLTHSLGHSKSSSFTVPPDTSGAKNPIQQLKSAITYARGVTFEAVCGLASIDANFDDDGNSAGESVSNSEIKKQEPPEVKTQFYSDADFTKNSASWKKLIESGKQSPDQIIAKVESKKPLSHYHKKEIRSWLPPAKDEFEASLDASGEYTPQ